MVELSLATATCFLSVTVASVPPVLSLMAFHTYNAGVFMSENYKCTTIDFMISFFRATVQS